MPQCKCDDGMPSGFTPSAPFGVWGDSGSAGPFGGGGNGAVGSSKASSGVFGITLADQNRAAGVYGIGPFVGAGGGLAKSNTAPSSRVGVYGTGSNGRNLGGVGVEGESDTSTGVLGVTLSGTGVFGDGNNGVGVRGHSVTQAGVVGFSARNTGVTGIGNDTGVIGIGGTLAALFLGNVQITGSLTKGGGGFTIDHPLAPGEKYLRHSFVESPDMKNFYDGIATCNKSGEATVKLPEWFEALNGDFRYQLTAVGAPGPNLHVKEEVKGGSFRIGGGSPNLKVSWQVTGVRRDPWAKANRIKVEENKAKGARGSLLHPEAHGQAGDKAETHALRPSLREYLKQL
jgi:hypothetical protein